MTSDAANLSVLDPFTKDEIETYIGYLRREAAVDVADAVEEALRQRQAQPRAAPVRASLGPPLPRA